MHNKKLTVAVDIDTVLLDKKGNLNQEALEIFKKADRQNTTFILLTNKSSEVARSVINKINIEIKGSVTSQCWVIANGGGKIVSPLGKVIQDKTFDNVRLMRIISMSKCVDNDCIYMYSTCNGNFVQVPQSNIANFTIWIYNLKDKKLGDSALNLQKIENFKEGRDMDAVTKEIGNINQLRVLSLNKDKKQKVQYAIKLEASKMGAVAYSDKYTTISTTSKLDAIKMILQTVEQSLQSTMTANIEDVIYLGNGVSDADCLNACDISATWGEKAHSKAKVSAKYNILHLSNFMDNVYNGVFDVFKENMEPEEKKGKLPEKILHLK